MKHQFKFLILSFLLVSNILPAATSQTEISKSTSQTLLLDKTCETGSIAHFDRLYFINNQDGSQEEVFSSDGRNIEKVYEADLDGDTTPEILIQMDLGGSGGFKELVLLKKSEDAYRQIWETTGFSGARTSISVNKEEGYALVRVQFMDSNFKPPKPSIAVFGYDKGDFKRLR